MNRNLDSNYIFPATRSLPGCAETPSGSGLPEVFPAVATVLARGAR
jgi:hypothetical protein